MPTDFDEIVDVLNKDVMVEMRRLYSEKAIALFLNPRNMGKIENAEGYGKVTGPCGDTMEIFLNIKDKVILNVAFTTDGCGPSIVCGSMVTELAKGMHITNASIIDTKKVLDKLGGLPEADQHCAKLAAGTLAKAISTYLKKDVVINRETG